MKKIIKGCLLTLSLLSFSLALPSCSPAYIKGETGEMGETGPKGEDGKDGKDGSIFHHGEGKPGDSLDDVYLFNLWINEDNPLVSSRLLVKETACITTYNWFTSVSGETLPYDHNLINGFIYDDLNVYPLISIDNEEVHKQDYYETEPYKPTKEEMDYIFKRKILDNFYSLRDYSFLKQYYPEYFGDESSN